MGDSSPVKNGYDHSVVPMDLSDKLLRTELEKKFMQGITNRNFALLEKTMDGFVDLELRIAPRYPDLVKQHLVAHMEQMLSAFSISVVEYDEAEAPVVAQYRALLEEGLNTVDPEARAEAYRKLDDWLYENYWFLPYCEIQEAWCHNDRIAEMKMASSNFGCLGDIKLA